MSHFLDRHVRECEDTTWRVFTRILTDDTRLPVLSKRDFVERYAKGEFGNASPTWQDVVHFAWKRLEGLFHLRNRIAGGTTYYNLTWEQVVNKWTSMDADESANWYCSAMAPSHLTTLQGELMETPQGLYLNYNQVPKPMREGFALQSDHSYGIITNCLLRQHMDANSYEWTMDLLRRYPDHVIEFSSYSIKWGTLCPLFNSVFWEVRRY